MLSILIILISYQFCEIFLAVWDKQPAAVRTGAVWDSCKCLLW